MTDHSGVSLSVLRDAIRRRIAATSARATATDIGLSASAVAGFLDGATPHPSSLRKMELWYLRACEDAPHVPLPAVRAALALLTEHIPPAHRDDVQRELVDVVKRATKKAKVPAPDWIGRARE